jgi:cyanophycin synthetase
VNFTLEAIKRAAAARGMRWSRPGGLDSDEFLVLHVGGVPVTVQKTRTPFMSAVALKVSTDKRLTARLLRLAGVPVLPQRLCEKTGPGELRFLARHAPLAVKPNASDRGVGVTVGVWTREELKAAVSRALVRGPALLEPAYEGRELRVLVVGGRCVACYERLPAGVEGDGVSTVAALVAALNSDPRRGELKAGAALARVPLDEDALRALAAQGLTPQSVPARGSAVRLCGPANIARGGESVDRTDELHPCNARLAERAAEAVGVDVAGVDFLCKDPARPIRSARDGVCLEVNSMPGVRGFLHPSRGRARPVLEAYLDYLEERVAASYSGAALRRRAAAA